jgi:hypothetical protein
MSVAGVSPVPAELLVLLLAARLGQPPAPGVLDEALALLRLAAAVALNRAVPTAAG